MLYALCQIISSFFRNPIIIIFVAVVTIFLVTTLTIMNIE